MAGGENSGADLSLLDSANAFLVEALRDYKAGKLNFAIVHAMIAVELMLKERLRQISPALIYENIDVMQYVRYI